MAIITVQFKVGVPRIDAIVRLHDTILSHRDWLPPELSVGEPLVKPKGIDDVPIVALTLWTKDEARGAFELERVAHAVEAELKRVPGTREVHDPRRPGPRRAGAARRRPAQRASASRPRDLTRALQAANTALPAGNARARQRDDRWSRPATSSQSAQDVRELVVGVHDGQPVYLADVARVVDGPPPPARYAWHGVGKAAAAKAARTSGARIPRSRSRSRRSPARTRSTSRSASSSASPSSRNTVIPAGVEVDASPATTARTADDKAKLLIRKLLFATLSVVALVFATLGRREAVIVGVAVLLTLAATLFASWAWGFTLNRVSLFALIFSIGILVDDAIVVVENIHRHRALDPDAPLAALIPGAVDEVGGPTILATFTVIAALLPMAFVTGLMGPYMSPIPINASMGMLISLAIAFMITPWLALQARAASTPAARATRRAGSTAGSPRRSRALLDAVRRSRARRRAAASCSGSASSSRSCASVALACVQLVVLKMLPFDNKSEFQVVVDMPAGTPVESDGGGARATWARTSPRSPR